MAEERDPPPPPEPPLSAGADDLRQLLLSLPENVASALSGVGQALEFELRGMAEALGGARWHGGGPAPEPLSLSPDLPEVEPPPPPGVPAPDPQESLWGGPAVYPAPDPGEAGEPLWQAAAELPNPSSAAWPGPPEAPPPGVAPARTVAPGADPWWAEEAGRAQAAEAGLPDLPVVESRLPTSADELPVPPGGEGGMGGADVLGVLERIAALLERLVEASGGEDAPYEMPQRLALDEPDYAAPADDGGASASPSIDVHNLFRPGLEQDAAGRPRAERPKRQRHPGAPD